MKHFLFLLLFFLISTFSFSQTDAQWHYSYDTFLMDSTYETDADPKLQLKIERLHHSLEKKMGTIVGYCPTEMYSFAPASPLSNFLTDLLLDYGRTIGEADLSLLNFGGIRTSFPSGNLTIGDIYKVIPFDNTVVVIALYGSELKKVFQRFDEKHNQPYSNVQIIYSQQRPFSVLVDGRPIEEKRIYHLLTLDFIADGGDNILKDIHFDDVQRTGRLFRNVVIDHIKALSEKKIPVSEALDQRAIIKLQQ